MTIRRDLRAARVGLPRTKSQFKQINLSFLFPELSRGVWCSEIQGVCALQFRAMKTENSFAGFLVVIMRNISEKGRRKRKIRVVAGSY